MADESGKASNLKSRGSGYLPTVGTRAELGHALLQRALPCCPSTSEQHVISVICARWGPRGGGGQWALTLRVVRADRRYVAACRWRSLRRWGGECREAFRRAREQVCACAAKRLPAVLRWRCVRCVGDALCDGNNHADVACQQEINTLRECRAKNASGSKDACSAQVPARCSASVVHIPCRRSARPPDMRRCCACQADAVLECRGSFLCPAVQAQWMKCMKAKAEGRPVVCDSEKAALTECVSYYQSK